jgi:hypothetical protein
MFKRLLILSFIVIALFTGCAGSQNNLTTLHGMLLVTDPDNAMPAADNAIYLVPLSTDQMVITVPSIPYDTAIQAQVKNETGEFTIKNVQAGKYIIMVLTIYKGEIPARTEAGSLAVIDVTESDLGKTIELNYLQVP